MNRQVVGFLSLFSLVLVLSVYYVASPLEKSPSQEVNNQHKEEFNVENDDYYFSSYSLIRDDNHRQVIDEQVSIISSSESTSAEVVSARERVELEERIMAAEVALQEVINNIPFNASYVEITENDFVMMAYKQGANADQELELVLSVFEKTDEFIISQNLSFINLDAAQVQIVY